MSAYAIQQQTCTSRHAIERFREIRQLPGEKNLIMATGDSKTNDSRRVAALIVWGLWEKNCTKKGNLYGGAPRNEKNVSKWNAEFGSNWRNKKDDLCVKQYMQRKTTSVDEKDEKNNQVLSITRNQQTRVTILVFWFNCSERFKSSV